jgi:hypothetical protein
MIKIWYKAFDRFPGFPAMARTLIEKPGVMPVTLRNIQGISVFKPGNTSLDIFIGRPVIGQMFDYHRFLGLVFVLKKLFFLIFFYLSISVRFSFIIRRYIIIVHFG